MPEGQLLERIKARLAAKSTPPAATTTQPAAAPLVSPQVDDLVNKYSTQYGVDPNLVHSVMKTETGGVSAGQRGSVSSKAGAVGYMQLMPDTAAQYGVTDIADPEQNIRAGVQHLKYLHDKYNGDITKTAAAYNAGEGNVAKYGGVPPFKQTQDYVNKVNQNYQAMQPTATDSSQGIGVSTTSSGGTNLMDRINARLSAKQTSAPPKASVVQQPFKQATTFEEGVGPSTIPESEAEQRKQLNIEQGGKRGMAVQTGMNAAPRAARESILGLAETAGMQATPEQNATQPFALGGPDSSGLVFSTGPIKTALGNLWNYATGKSNVEKYAHPLQPGEQPSFEKAIEPVKELGQQAIVNPAKEIYQGAKEQNIEKVAHGVGGIAPVAYGAVKAGFSGPGLGKEPTRYASKGGLVAEEGGFQFRKVHPSAINMSDALAETGQAQLNTKLRDATEIGMPDLKQTEQDVLGRSVGKGKNSSAHQDAAWVADQTKNRIFNNEVAPAIDSIQQPIDLTQAGKSAKSALAKIDMSPAERTAAETEIDRRFNQTMSPREAETLRQQLHAEARTIESKYPVEKAALEKTPEGARKSVQYDALRDALYDHVQQNSGLNLADSYKRYGAVSEISNALNQAPRDTGLYGQLKSRFAPGTGKGMTAKAGQIALGYFDSRNKLIQRAFKNAEDLYKPSKPFQAPLQAQFMPQMPAPPPTGLPSGGPAPTAIGAGQGRGLFLNKGPQVGQQGVQGPQQIPPAPNPLALNPIEATHTGQPHVEWSPSDIKYMPQQGPRTALGDPARNLITPGNNPPQVPKQIGTGGLANLPGPQGGVMTQTGPVTPQTQRPYTPPQPIQTGQTGGMTTPRNATVTPTGPRTALRYANPTVKQPPLSPYQNVLNNSIDMRINSIRDLAASGATESVGKTSSSGVRIGSNKQPGSRRVKTGFAESAGLKGIDESPKVIATALKNKKGALYERIRKQVADQVESEEGEGIRQYVESGGGQ